MLLAARSVSSNVTALIVPQNPVAQLVILSYRANRKLLPLHRSGERENGQQSCAGNALLLPLRNRQLDPAGMVR